MQMNSNRFGSPLVMAGLLIFLTGCASSGSESGPSKRDNKRLAELQCKVEAQDAIPKDLHTYNVERQRRIRVADGTECETTESWGGRIVTDCQTRYRYEYVPYTATATIDLNKDARKAYQQSCVLSQCNELAGNPLCDPKLSGYSVSTRISDYQIKDDKDLRRLARAKRGKDGSLDGPDGSELELNKGREMSLEEYQALRPSDRSQYIFFGDDFLVSYPLNVDWRVFGKATNPLTNEDGAYFWFRHETLGLCTATAKKSEVLSSGLTCELALQCTKAGVAMESKSCRVVPHGTDQEVIVDSVRFENGDVHSFRATHYH